MDDYVFVDLNIGVRWQWMCVRSSRSCVRLREEKNLLIINDFFEMGLLLMVVLVEDYSPGVT